MSDIVERLRSQNPASREEAAAEIERLRKALRFYANPEVYKPHPHGMAFDQRDLSYVAVAALSDAPADVVMGR